jgi:hypothetical protein
MQETPPTTRFTAEMPHIPGVGDPSAKPPISSGKQILLSIGLATALLLIGVVVRRAVNSMGQQDQRPPEVTQGSPAEPQNLPAVPTSTTWGPVTAATLNELAKPWSSKEFTFVDPITHSTTPAIVVHLPGGPANSSASYWAFSLEVPYQNCQLQYIADLEELATRFGFHAAHPMVASTCDDTVYDPLKMGTIPTGAWVRGEIVQGAGIRPPTSIEIKLQGNNLVADRIE